MPSDLFSCISLELGRNRQDVEQRGREQVIAVSSAEADRLIQVLYTSLKTGGFCTYLVTGHRPWGDRSADFEGARSAAKRGCRIERAFLLPDRYLRHDPNLKQHLDLDVKAGIRTLVLYVGDLIAELAACSPGSLEFGVWDREMCSMAMYGAGETSNGPSECRVTARDEDVRRGRRLADLLKEKAETVGLGDGEPTSPARLEEPLIVSAPIARRIAPRLCRQHPVSGKDCSRYHGTRQYLRLFNMVNTPAGHADFFLDALGSLAREGGYRRVLVSGTGDYSMPAHVLWAYRTNNVSADVTVVDICETPLFMSRWYAKTVGASVETDACDILDYDGAKPFDVICSHMFLRQFTPERRGSLIAKWRRLLRPGGKVVLVTLIESTRVGDSLGLRPDRGTVMRERALREAERWRDFLDVDPEELARLAQLFVEQPRTYSVGSREHVVDLLEGGGFTLDRLESVDKPTTVPYRARYPKAPRNVEFASIVATRL